MHRSSGYSLLECSLACTLLASIAVMTMPAYRPIAQFMHHQKTQLAMAQLTDGMNICLNDLDKTCDSCWHTLQPTHSPIVLTCHADRHFSVKTSDPTVKLRCDDQWGCLSNASRS